jgi:hypothetical protein
VTAIRSGLQPPHQAPRRPTHAQEIFERDGRKVALTQAGEVLCALARKILALHSEAQSALRMPSSGHMHGVQVYIHIIVNKNEMTIKLRLMCLPMRNCYALMRNIFLIGVVTRVTTA